jgi:ABC-type Na+ efflux pump permease subunit
MVTAWLVLAGGQMIRSPGDMARFGGLLFHRVLCPLQLAITFFYAALATASSVAQEKDRRTLILLLMTRMENRELVLGKLAAGWLHVLVMIAAGIPVFALCTLFGGVSGGQFVRATLVTVASSLFASAIGTTVAFWREKTFQTLAMTALVLCFWLALGEAVASGVLGANWWGIETTRWAAAFSPIRALGAAVRPGQISTLLANPLQDEAVWFLIVSVTLSCLATTWGTLRVRVWNPSREARPAAAETVELKRPPSATDTRHSRPVAGLSEQPTSPAEEPPTGRRVWNNPVLWREVCTWAYGRKIWVIRAAYLILFAMAAWAIHAWALPQSRLGTDTDEVIPALAWALVPLFLLSLVIVNALAVTAITTERDGKSLDLLLTTDLSPKEFVFGKLGGVMSVATLMIILPLILVLTAWWRGGMITENLVFITCGLLVMDLFVATLGLHCGMRYANSQTAVAVSLGTVFFLFLGVISCMLLMISFSGSFQVQLGPFLALILGGGVGLYVALGAHNPSRAIGVVSFLVPFFTFYAITSFLLRFNLSVFLVLTVTYGFTTWAMLVPAISEFDFALDQSAGSDD